ncbi:MAG: hypothetical protein NTV34_04215 [Proteobacteria bacterium]|nr:hypothetical protein [Pseudomonadota bacterium]
MNKFRSLVVASPSFSKNSLLVAEAGKLADRLTVNSEATKWSESSLKEWLLRHEADGVIIGTEAMSRFVIDDLPLLKAVGKYGVGCDNIDLKALADRRVYFGWEGGVNRRSVSELVLSFMLGHCRNVFSSVSHMQQGRWLKEGGVHLSGRTIGIVGLGFIGTDLAKILAPFGCNLLYCDIVDRSREAKELGVKVVTYRDLIAQSDIVSFHVPGGAETKNMFGVAELSIAKRDLLVINTSRGGVVDLEATVEAVRKKRIGGYAADVFPVEPMQSSEFSIHDGFYFTPHIGGNAEEAVLAMGRSAIKMLRIWLSRTDA